MLVPLSVLADLGALILHDVGHTCNESLIHGPVAIKEYLHLMSSEVETHFCRSSMGKMWPEGADGDGGPVCGEC